MAVEEHEGLPRDIHTCAVHYGSVPVDVHNHTLFYAADNRYVHSKRERAPEFGGAHGRADFHAGGNGRIHSASLRIAVRKQHDVRAHVADPDLSRQESAFRQDRKSGRGVL